MNSLFGCRFQVMDAHRGYSQTTKGLWIGRDSLSPSLSSSSGSSSGGPLQRPVLILDVEGLDSRERGDRRQTYENFFSLFALTLADCLLINISCSALGCHTSSGFGLLKTIMEANLELFMQQDDVPKTILLFVVRDWAPTIIPDDVMRERIKRDYVEKIWAEIEKPASVADSRASDFFCVEVVGLAHKLLAPADFDRDVAALRDKWANELSPKLYSRHIPSDGFGAYARSIWATIQQQSHLDIPNQKEMLAIYRCQDLKQQALLAAAARATALQQQHPKPTAADAAAIKEEISAIAEEAIEQYMAHATRYQERICLNVKEELLEALVSAFKPLIDSQLTEAKERIVRRRKDALREMYTPDSKEAGASIRGELMVEAWADFRTRSAAAMAAASEEFEAFSESCSTRLKGGDCLHFPSGIVADSLRQEMHREVETLREMQQKALDAAIAEKCADGYSGLEALLTSRSFSPSVFWETCRGRAAANATVCTAHFATAARGLEGDSGEGDASAAADTAAAPAAAAAAAFAVRCRMAALWQLRAALCKLAGTLNVYVVERFTVFFSFDEEDRPRRWELMTAEKLQALFLTAKNEALSLIATLREVQLEDLSLSSPTLQRLASEGKGEKAEDLKNGEEEETRIPAAFFKPLLDALSEQTIQRKAVSVMQQQCREAQLLQQRCGSGVSWRSVPLWGWLLLLCLGWNELAAVVSFTTSSWLLLPMLLLLLLLGAGVAFSGRLDVLLNGTSHITQLLRLLLQPFLYGMLRRLTDLMDVRDRIRLSLSSFFVSSSVSFFSLSSMHCAALYTPLSPSRLTASFPVGAFNLPFPSLVLVPPAASVSSLSVPGSVLAAAAAAANAAAAAVGVSVQPSGLAGRGGLDAAASAAAAETAYLKKPPK
ncbi:hypothetical protein Efla_004608 [Eimeria flavescens]